MSSSQRSRRGHRACVALLALLVCVAGQLGGIESAHAKKAKKTPVPTVRHELPFGCGTWWTGSTRNHHSPSKHSVDFNAPGDEGKAILASARGTVTKADNSATKGYGRHVVIDHGNGESTLYAHMKRVFVKTGATVDQGTYLGDLGNTGNSSGAHLHYEQRVGKTVVAPWIGGKPYRHTRTQSVNCVDTPVAGDLLEEAGTEVAVFRRTAAAQYLVRRANGTTSTMAVGRGVDDPVIGDWDGDGQMDPGAWSPRTKKFTLAGESGFITITQGTRGDRPVAGDWNGDGRWEVGVRRGTTFRLRAENGTVTVVTLGKASDLPVTGDWNGDGTTDVGVYDPRTSVFTLRTATRAGVALSTVAHGAVGDLPVTGDWNGDGLTDVATWSPGIATFSQRDLVPGTLARARTVRFGKAR